MVRGKFRAINDNIKKKIKDLSKWEMITCSWQKTLNTVQMTICPKLSYRFNTNATRIPPDDFFVEIHKPDLEFL